MSEKGKKLGEEDGKVAWSMTAFSETETKQDRDTQESIERFLRAPQGGDRPVNISNPSCEPNDNFKMAAKS